MSSATSSRWYQRCPRNHTSLSRRTGNEKSRRWYCVACAKCYDGEPYYSPEEIVDLRTDDKPLQGTR